MSENKPLDKKEEATVEQLISAFNNGFILITLDENGEPCSTAIQGSPQALSFAMIKAVANSREMASIVMAVASTLIHQGIDTAQKDLGE